MMPFRFLFLSLSFVVASFFSLLVCIARPFHPENNKICARLYAWGGLRSLGLRVRLQGWQHLPQNEPHVIIANHQSNLDLFVIGQVVPRNSVAVGKESLGLIPLFGQIFWLGGNVLIRRRSHKQAMAAMKASAHALTVLRRSVWIFPEGTRSRGRGLLPFKKGAFHTAIAAGVPISIVCVSDYAAAMMRRGEAPPVATIRVLPPVPTAHLAPGDAAALMNDCRDIMARHLDELNGVVDRSAGQGDVGDKAA